MRPRPCVLALLATVLAVSLTACGDGEEDLLREGTLRDCLAGEGLKVEAPDLTASASLGSVSPDFRAVAGDGAGIDVVVQGSEQKASRSAADIEAALQTLGAPGAEVTSKRNAIAVFEQTPTDATRQAVETCLG